jgi:hypothetical protein
MNNRFSKLFLVGVACAALFVRSHADAATYYFDLHAKTLEGGTMAIGESADIILRNIGESSPANLRTLLCDKEGVPLAASTNGFSAHGTAARGRMSLATTNLAARFEGMGALKEIPLVFAVWDATLGTLLGSDTVQIRNNPFADATGSVPSDWGGVDYGDKAIAQLALAMAQLALDTANATSGRMDALQGEYEAATNALWETIGDIGAGTSGLSGRVDTLESRVGGLGEAMTNAVSDLRADVETNRESIAALDTAINGSGGVTNRLQKMEAATNALNSLSRTNLAAITDIKAYTNKVGAATNALNSATNTLDTLARTNAAAISDLWEAVGDLATNGVPPYNIENLEGWTEGPAWLTPARFAWSQEQHFLVTTNTGPETDCKWAVLIYTQQVVTTPEFTLTPEIARNAYDETFSVTIAGPATLTPVGNGSYTLSWNAGTETVDVATVTGELGSWVESTTVAKPQSGEIKETVFFSSFAVGSVREALAGIMTGWTNRGGSTQRLVNHSSSALTNFDMRTSTSNIWPNPNFWGRDLDWSGVSFVNDSTQPWYRPATLVASNLAYGAAHFSPAIGTTVAWYGKDGEVHTSKIVDQRRLSYDLCLSKLDPPLDTAIVATYPILDTAAALPHVQECGAGQFVGGLPPLPVVSLHQGQRAYIMNGYTSGGRGFIGGIGGIWDANRQDWALLSRGPAVGGDSGHPVFLSLNATNMVLYGSWWTTLGISTPGDEIGKPLILSAAESMGADPNSIAFETLDNWPKYYGDSVPPMGGSPSSAKQQQNEEEEEP